MSGVQSLHSFRRLALGLTAACLPISIAASNVCGALALAACVVLLFADPSRREYRWTGLEIPWLIYLSVWFAASALSPSPARSLSKLSAYVTILFFLLASQGQDKDDLTRNVKIFLAACGVAGLWGVLQYVSGADWNPGTNQLSLPDWMTSLPSSLAQALATRNGRSLGFFSHPLTYAEVLLVGWTLSLAQIFQLHRKAGPFWLFVFFATSGGLLCSESRGVWLSMFVLLAVWGVVRRKKRVLMALGLLVAAGGLLVAFNPKVQHRVQSLRHVAVDPSSNIRLGLWRAAGRAFAERPVLGVGMGNVRLVSGAGPEPNKVWSETHNIFLQAGVEAGIVGLAAFCGFLFAAARLLWRASSPGWRDGLFFAFVGILFAGLTESWMRDAEVMIVMNFILGSAALAMRRKQDA